MVKARCFRPNSILYPEIFLVLAILEHMLFWQAFCTNNREMLTAWFISVKNLNSTIGKNGVIRKISIQTHLYASRAKILLAKKKV